MKSKERDLINGAIPVGLFLFTVPIILSGLLQLLYNAADIIVVGRYAGSSSLAAVGSTSSLTNLLINLFIGLSSGATVCVAHFIGAKDSENTQRSVHTSVFIGLFGGILLMTIGIILSKPLLSLMGTPDNILDEAALYMKIIFMGMPANMVYNFGSGIIRASGNTKTPLFYLTLSGIINVILNLVFVIVFSMNAAGVGIATIISQYLSAFLIIRYLLTLDNDCKLYIKKIRLYKSILIRILQIGIPAGIQSITFSLSNVLIQSSINSFGSNAIAGNSAASSIEGLVYISMNSFHHSVLTYVGQNVGARKTDRVKKLIIHSCIQVVLVGIIMSAILLMFNRPLLSLYAPDDEAVIAFGRIRLIAIVIPYFLCGIMDVLVGCLRGMGTSFMPMCASIAGICGIRIVWLFTVFRKFRTLTILYASYGASWFVTALIQAIFTVIIYKRLKQSVRAEQKAVLNKALQA